MVYIHGGSFRLGSAQEYWPNYLLEEDVVLVVPQYRLGPLGESPHVCFIRCFCLHDIHAECLLGYGAGIAQRV
jgi:hypothetical protein